MIAISYSIVKPDNTNEQTVLNKVGKKLAVLGKTVWAIGAHRAKMVRLQGLSEKVVWLKRRRSRKLHQS